MSVNGPAKPHFGLIYQLPVDFDDTRDASRLNRWMHNKSDTSGRWEVFQGAQHAYAVTAHTGQDGRGPTLNDVFHRAYDHSGGLEVTTAKELRDLFQPADIDTLMAHFRELGKLVITR